MARHRTIRATHIMARPGPHAPITVALTTAALITAAGFTMAILALPIRRRSKAPDRLQGRRGRAPTPVVISAVASPRPRLVLRKRGSKAPRRRLRPRRGPLPGSGRAPTPVVIPAVASPRPRLVLRKRGSKAPRRRLRPRRGPLPGSGHALAPMIPAAPMARRRPSAPQGPHPIGNSRVSRGSRDSVISPWIAPAAKAITATARPRVRPSQSKPSHVNQPGEGRPAAALLFTASPLASPFEFLGTSGQREM